MFYRFDHGIIHQVEKDFGHRKKVNKLNHYKYKKLQKEITVKLRNFLLKKNFTREKKITKKSNQKAKEKRRLNSNKRKNKKKRIKQNAKQITNI